MVRQRPVTDEYSRDVCVEFAAILKEVASPYVYTLLPI